MTTSTARPQRRLSGKLADLGIVAVALAIAVTLLVGTFTMNIRGNAAPGPTFFPLLVSGLLFLVAVGLLIIVLRESPDEPEPEHWHRPDISEEMLRTFGGNIELLARHGDTLAALSNDRSDDAPSTPGADDRDTAQPIDWRTVGFCVGAVVLFVLTLQILGWILAASLLFWIMARAFGSRRPLFDVGVALLMASIVQLLFVAGLGLSLPSGFVGRIL